MSEGFREKTKYGVEKPPLSISVASERIIRIDVILNEIGTAQRLKTAKSFRSEDEFIIWHRKSTDAAGHFSRERDFLIDWIKITEQVNRGRLNQARRDALELRVKESVSDSSYQVVYNGGSPPEGIHEAWCRIFYLSFIENNYAKVVNGTRDEGFRLSVSSHLIDRMLEPLLAKLRKVRAEIKFLQEFVKRPEPKVASSESSGADTSPASEVKRLREQVIKLTYPEIICFLVKNGLFTLEDEEDRQLFEKIQELVAAIEARDRV